MTHDTATHVHEADPPTLRMIPSDYMILSFWQMGLNTVEIAEEIPTSFRLYGFDDRRSRAALVANRLATLRDWSIGND